MWAYAPGTAWSTDPIAIRVAQGWRYPQANHLATAQQVVDGQGTLLTTIRVNAYGETRVQGTRFDSRFPGQIKDAETSLHYNRYRSFDPKAARYVQVDPLGLAGGLNVFAYAAGNPNTYMDPLGLCACEDEPCSCSCGTWSTPFLGGEEFGLSFGGYFEAGRSTYSCDCAAISCDVTTTCFGGGVTVGVTG